MAGFFNGAANVDARYGVFNSVAGNQTIHYTGRPANRQAGNRMGPQNPPSRSDDDDPPSWMSGHPDPPSFSPRHPDPPSWSSQSTDPPSWSSRSADPPAWSMRRGLPAQSTFSTESQEPRSRLGIESISWASPQHAGTSPIVSSLAPTSISSYAPLSIIHTKKLPTSNKTLDSALTNVDLSISPWKTPSEYIAAEKNYVNNIVHEIQDLTGRVEIEHASFGRTMIYSRLIVYILAHAMLCSNDQSLVKDCINSLQKWETNDIVTKVQSYHEIKDSLQRVYRRLGNSHSRHTAYPDRTFQKLLTLDTITLSAHLTVIITNDNEYKNLLSRREKDAQSLLNLLQARLNISIDPQYKSRHVKALIKLSKLSGMVPECLVLKGIEVKGDPVAGGGFGDVYKAKYQRQEIALKVLKVYQKSDMQKLLKDFSCEATTWRQLDHPNVLPFYGVFHLNTNPKRVCLASPWLENGNVVQYLAEQAPNTDCVPLCLDIAQGLEYLHGEGIIHGDIKGLNILIAKSGRACLADFGLATSRDSRPIIMTYITTQSTRGTVRWQAPELIPDMQGPDPDIIDRRNTMATDIYAYALVCHEMFSAEFPFHEIPSDFQVMFAVKHGKRPSRPTHDLSRTRGLNDAIWQIIEACWNQDPDERYTANKAVVSLRNLPDRPDDCRPLDDFDKALPSQVFSTRDRVDQNPFSILEQNDDDADMNELKWISREVSI